MHAGDVFSCHIFESEGWPGVVRWTNQCGYLIQWLDDTSGINFTMIAKPKSSLFGSHKKTLSPSHGTDSWRGILNNYVKLGTVVFPPPNINSITKHNQTPGFLELPWVTHLGFHQHHSTSINHAVQCIATRVIWYNFSGLGIELHWSQI